ncbi:uncharacterized protein V1510DRAFT_406237 [Dipodascopsis tothii]|uniref:uncharacterized protein n=1 Tax=Dipodascopsis tothii TaxID=44089 RepID=UPI0034CEECA0
MAQALMADTTELTPPSTPQKYRSTAGMSVLTRPFKSPLKRACTAAAEAAEAAAGGGAGGGAGGAAAVGGGAAGGAVGGLAGPSAAPRGSGLTGCGGPGERSPQIRGRRPLATPDRTPDSGRPPACGLGLSPSMFREQFLAPSDGCDARGGRGGGLRGRQRTAAQADLVDPLVQKQEAALDRSLAQAAARIAQARQAHRYASATVVVDGLAMPKDDHVELLVARWRAAAQLAAQDLFEVAEERVRRMGGVAEFRRRTSRQHGGRPAARAEPCDEYDEYDYDVAVGGGAAAEPDDEFTMAMMLRSLNVDYSAVFDDDTPPDPIPC